MELTEAKILVEELKGRFDFPFGSSDKDTIEKLYLEVCGKRFRPTSCQNCYHDALLEVINYLKHHNAMATKSNFMLKAGAIIHSPLFNCGTVYTNDNLTDEVAKSYLNKFPNQLVLFQKVPEGFKPGQKEKPTIEEALKMKEKAEKVLEDAEKKVERIRENIKSIDSVEKKTKGEKALAKAEKDLERAQKGLSEVEGLIAELGE